MARFIGMHHSDKMAAIRQQVSTQLDLQAGSTGIATETNPDLTTVVLRGHWNFAHYLLQNYDLGLSQDLATTIAITGGFPNTQMCTIGAYFKTRWPNHSDELLSAIREGLSTFRKETLQEDILQGK